MDTYQNWKFKKYEDIDRQMKILLKAKMAIIPEVIDELCATHKDIERENRKFDLPKCRIQYFARILMYQKIWVGSVS